MVLLILLPFIDRNPERNPLKRPIATLAGITTIAAMTYLSVEGALAGAPTEIDMGVSKQLEPGKAVAASSGCLGCHKIGENGNSGPGPALTNVGSRLPRQAIARTLINPTPPMPSFSKLRQQNPKQFDQLVSFLSSLK
jgi:ubiquinol-cytochrome c reductase cytochrome b subunit/menaquinol-cytochrome c reductase cytochrome b/c subunit